MEQFILQLGIMSLQACVVICVVLLVREIFARVGIAKKYINMLWILPNLCMVCPWKMESALGFWRQPRGISIKDIQQVLAQAQGATGSFPGDMEEVTTTGSPIIGSSIFSHTE